jgi:hypothetical protein
MDNGAWDERIKLGDCRSLAISRRIVAVIVECLFESVPAFWSQEMRLDIGVLISISDCNSTDSIPFRYVSLFLVTPIITHRPRSRHSSRRIRCQIMAKPFKTPKKSDYLRLGDDTYLLQKQDKGAKSSMQNLERETESTRSRDQYPNPMKFEDPRLERMKTYEYDPLPEKSIRLMRLHEGALTDTVHCELIEAVYNNSFHIPTEVSPKTKTSQTGDSAHRRPTKEEELVLLKEELAQKEKEFNEEKLRFTEDSSRSTDEEDDSRNSREAEIVSRKIKEAEVEKSRLVVQAKELEIVEELEVEYEALSWCWGSDKSSYGVVITKGTESYKMRIRKDLVLALTYLRHMDRKRTLWIDAICIDQENAVERNQQVQMMSRIYTRAENVCIWLGEQDDQSEVAFKFIEEEITHLKDFDSISSDKDYSSKWHSLMELMQREWFSRRWVVQELSLAKKADIWCGPDTMPWKEFAVAVELFVEVESATHRLSEVMQKDEKYQHVPGWFEHVSELGASLLVQETGKVFRAYGTPMDENKDNNNSGVTMTDREKAVKEREEKEAAKVKKHELRIESLKDIQTIDPLDRRSLLSLEFLVTTMSIFKASECRDSVYSMLAIARDAAPFAEPHNLTNDTSFRMSLFEGFLAEKPFLVDYARPYSDVCRDFMEFCIQRKSSQDPVQALDILCRPWALEPQAGRSIRVKSNETSPAEQDDRAAIDAARLFPSRPRWERRKCEVRVRQVQNMPKWRYVKTDVDVKHFDRRTMDEWRAEVLKEDARWESWETDGIRWEIPEGWEKVIKLCKEARRLKEEKKAQKKKGGNVGIEPSKDMELPSWVPRAKNAPFEIYRHPGIQIKKTGRSNADPLVGLPLDGHRNYGAAQTETVKLDCLKFKKRPNMGHYSLYVAGFKVDKVKEVRDASQGGSIPNSWLELSDWEEPYDKDPPAQFWRTLVADRGVENRNPPYYYARACRESVDKGGRESGSVNTTALINNERNSIIAEFCRRVQTVIWGRSLFKTEGGKLGLAKGVKEGDLVCVLHGCTVPVILSQKWKKEGEREEEEFEDKYEAFKSCFRRLENICVQKRRYRDQKKKHEKLEKLEAQEGHGRQGMMQAREGLEVRDQQEEPVGSQKKRKKKRHELLWGCVVIFMPFWVQTLFLLPLSLIQAMHKQPEAHQGDKPYKSKWEQDVIFAQGKANRILDVDRKLRKVQQDTDQQRKDVLKPQKPDGSERKEPKPRFKRNKETFYEFKGETYVHGCMDGEAVRNRFYGEEGEWIYELR